MFKDSNEAATIVLTAIVSTESDVLDASVHEFGSERSMLYLLASGSISFFLDYIRRR
jgi:hypothetical protein